MLCFRVRNLYSTFVVVFLLCEQSMLPQYSSFWKSCRILSFLIVDRKHTHILDIMLIISYINFVIVDCMGNLYSFLTFDYKCILHVVQLDGMGLNRGIIMHLLKNLAFLLECRCIFLKAEYWLSSHDSYTYTHWQIKGQCSTLTLFSVHSCLKSLINCSMQIQVIKGWRWEWSGNEGNSISLVERKACNIKGTIFFCLYVLDTVLVYNNFSVTMQRWKVLWQGLHTHSIKQGNLVEPNHTQCKSL